MDIRLDLQTPCLLLDRRRLDANIARFDARARQLGVALRPHLKTAKSIEVARRIPSVDHAGVTVSTLKEAEYFAAAGLRDIFYAVCIPPRKVARAARLLHDGVALQLCIDDPGALREVQSEAERAQVCLPLRIELDCGEHRSGVDARSDVLIELARSIHGHPWTTLAGVFTHAGHSYDARDAAGRLAIAQEERASVVEAATRIEAAGLPCEVRSVGSTPSFAAVDHLEGITEARPGVYLFGDLFQAGIESCRREDIALSVLTTVIGYRREPHRLLVDAGGLALSKDRSTAALPEGDCAFGLVCDLDGVPIEGLRVTNAFQEHGVIDLPEDFDASGFAIGRQLRVLPNHACMTASGYDRYAILGKLGVEETWRRRDMAAGQRLALTSAIRRKGPADLIDPPKVPWRPNRHDGLDQTGEWRIRRAAGRMHAGRSFVGRT